MTLAVALGALAVALAALGLTGAAFAAALSRADRAAAAERRAAEADGRVAAAAVEIERAHDAIAEVAAAERRQRTRADALEEELSHADAYPLLAAGPEPVDRPGRARLRSSLRHVAADRSTRAGGAAGAPAVPDPAAAGAARTGGGDG